jgi:hypothetical protein
VSGTRGVHHGRAEELGRRKAEARAETRADSVLTVLRVRGIAVPDAAPERILAQKDLEQLKRWHDKAIFASSIGEVLDGALGERNERRSSWPC